MNMETGDRPHVANDGHARPEGRPMRAADRVRVRSVLLSVSDKTGLESLIRGLATSGQALTLYSTGGTYRETHKLLQRDAGAVSLRSIEEYTGYPEMPGGLVKTLHPRVHGGLLGDLNDPGQLEHMQQQGMVPFDLVVVNLYPFAATVARPGSTLEDARQNIDIGGPTMLRAAAKNFVRVAVVVDPNDYAPLLDELSKNGGEVSFSTRFELARKAFHHVLEYDQAIADYLTGVGVDHARGSYDVG